MKCCKNCKEWYDTDDELHIVDSYSGKCVITDMELGCAGKSAENMIMFFIVMGILVLVGGLIWLLKSG